MKEYVLTGRKSTDECLKAANEAHNLYFADKLGNAKEFAEKAMVFFDCIRKKFEEHARQASDKEIKNTREALNIIYQKVPGTATFLDDELRTMKNRLKTISSKPFLMTEDKLFILDYVARFMEAVLPYACDVKEEVERHSKFNLKELGRHEFSFFRHDEGDGVENDYLYGFFESAWRAQKSLNGFAFMEDYVEDSFEPKIRRFYKIYGRSDVLGASVFIRMANEQYLKYLTSAHPEFWDLLSSNLPAFLNDAKKKKIIAERDVNDPDIKVPSRISTLKQAKVIDELIANEIFALNTRGNAIAHRCEAPLFSTCYHGLETLNYLKNHCK